MKKKLHHIKLGNGKPIIFLHGFGLDHSYLMTWYESHFDLPFQRIYLDLPTMGGSHQIPATSADQLLLEVLNFVESLNLSERALIIAHSYGAYIARGLVSLRPDGRFHSC